MPKITADVPASLNSVFDSSSAFLDSNEVCRKSGLRNGELIASIAHEINQPLTAIVTNADAGLRWLSGDDPNLQETGEAMRRIIRDAKRASATVSRMRALFKRTPTETEPLDLNEVIREIVTVVHGEDQGNGISLRTDLADDLPRVMGDRIQLQQVILNLLVNAIQALSEISEGTRELCVSSHKGSQIHPEQSEDNGEGLSTLEEISIEVRDTGPGLDPENLHQLFEAFYTTKPHGLGIGLAISRAIVEAHGGRLWAKSNQPRGAVFQFSLPVRRLTRTCP